MNITQNAGPESYGIPASIPVNQGDTLTFEDDGQFTVQINGPGSDKYGPSPANASGSKYTYTSPGLQNPVSYSVSYGPPATGTNQIIVTPSSGQGKKKGR